MTIEQIVKQLDAEIAILQQARAALTGGPLRAGRSAIGERGRRHMSAEARARIAAAQRARWARVKSGQKKK